MGPEWVMGEKDELGPAVGRLGDGWTWWEEGDPCREAWHGESLLPVLSDVLVDPSIDVSLRPLIWPGKCEQTCRIIPVVADKDYCMR